MKTVDDYTLALEKCLAMIDASPTHEIREIWQQLADSYRLLIAAEERLQLQRSPMIAPLPIRGERMPVI